MDHIYITLGYLKLIVFFFIIMNCSVAAFRFNFLIQIFFCHPVIAFLSGRRMAFGKGHDSWSFSSPQRRENICGENSEIIIADEELSVLVGLLVNLLRMSLGGVL